MGIDKIEIRDHDSLLNQDWTPHTGLNIITSKNGGGKTKLLEYIYGKYHSKDRNIKALLTSIHNFKNYLEIKDYAKKNMIPPESRQFEEEYEMILKLQTEQSLINECNAFLSSLGLHIKLYDAMVKGGALYFQSRNNIVGLPLKSLSTGEKTAFILWLITKCQKIPNILLLDEFDSSMDDDIVLNFYEILESMSHKTQIFIATHRERYLVYTKEKNQQAHNISDLGRIGDAKLIK